MAIRVTHKVRPQLFADSDEKNALFSLDDTLSERVIATFTKHASGDFSIAADATESLSMGDIEAVKGLYIDVDADCVVKLNGGSEEIQMRAQTSATAVVGAKMFIECDITDVNITAGADATLSGSYCIWGDLEA